ncbi:LIM and calponin homology domains-containing protein 1-like isoform X2 [Notolabrus celidotus]|uniref:LIM and calponin homology domains-containing protein 1-like isoform X2 n=1 Tax=Notolabrus celidotus TaxID=1203425 RepID=UPI00148F9C39|nr:LIM and calponin homology domains-containing protein 1-like isoform X2 [Notolabrus celidotus]
MASPAAGRDVPNAQTRDDSERLEPHHPEPACQEAQKWIEAVTGKSFGERDFRSGLENGILLCELLSAIKPGLVKKINRLPTPIAGLDNLSVFLRGCEELGLRGSQLFDPGDLQDTSIRANLRDSDCTRKLKNVLNTVFWLGKAACGCASYSGPTLNLKEFEGLLAQMKVEVENGGDSSQKRSVRDSGYDCWDSERSESLSPPQHTRDNSLDSLDSFGSRSQHSPSPDVVNRGNSDGRGSDSEADGSSRRPDVRKDDMLARRHASSEARSSIPFNQFLPNRTNVTSYIPTPRRKPHTEEGEQRRSVSMGDILNEDEVGHLPPMSQSKYERMHEQYNNFPEEEDHWRDDLAKWKTRRRSASQELIKKEEERKKLEKRLKEEGSDSNKRKSIKTYKEIVEEKERRELELCDAYRNAATPEEAAMVLQRYALRFTISDATLDSLKLPRSTSKPNQEHKDHKTLPVSETEKSEPLQHKPEPAAITDLSCTKPEEMESDRTAQEETSDSVSSSTTTPSSPLTPVINSDPKPPQSLQLHEPQTKAADSPNTHQKEAAAEEAKLQTNHTPPQTAHVKPHTTQPGHTLPSPSSVPSRPVPILAAKPYCQPKSAQAGHKHVKMDGLVRVNGETTEDISTPTTPSPQEIKDVPPKQTEKEVPSEQSATNQKAAEQTTPPQIPLPQPPPPQKTPQQPPPPQTTPQQPPPPQKTPQQPPPPQTTPQQPSPPQTTPQQLPPPETTPQQPPPPQTTPQQPPPPKTTPKQPPPPETTPKQPPPPQKPLPETPPQQTSPSQTEKTASSSASAISSLIGGRNCIITTTIVTELTQTVVEPLQPDIQSNGQVNGATVFSERPSEETQTPPATSPNSMQDYSPTVTEGLEESSVSEQYEKEQEKLKKEWEKAQIEVQEEERKHNEEERKILEETVTPLNPTGVINPQSEQSVPTSSSTENEKKADTFPVQLNGQRISTGSEDQHATKLHFFQESAGDSETSKKQELWKTASLDRNPQLNQPHIVKRSESQDGVTNKQKPSPSAPHPPSPTRCVSGKRLCSGCSQPLGKGAAMIIDTLGLFFHIQCFKCGVCKGQLGDATTGTDVRIRNGLLSCHECYIASRGRGQPTTL